MKEKEIPQGFSNKLLGSEDARARLMPQNIMEGLCEQIELEPFVHQVGGHSSMLRFDDTTVCKPLITREHKFYETMPNDMRRFTPEYRGVIKVAFQEDRDGYLSLMACPIDDKAQQARKSSKRSLTPGSYPNSGGEEAKSDSDSECSGARASGSAKQRFRVQKSGSIEIEGIPEKVRASIEEHKREKQKILPTGHNPWSLRCHKEQLAKMHKSVQDSQKDHKFILLENVASQYEYPCILDLKMGQRQHGDDASEMKRLSQIKKCENTTSSRLGVRICGMQVYQKDTGHFLCHNKYYGRKLDENGLNSSLKQFLHDGHKLRLELIDEIIEKLSQLYKLLEKQNTFRFYSSSLLVMYDGNDEGSSDMIMDMDCSESSFQSGLRDDSYSSSSSFTDHVHCVHHPSGMDSTGTSTSKCKVCTHNAGVDEHSIAGHSGTAVGSEATSAPGNTDRHLYNSHHHKPNKVDVRMIDFAHATYRGFRGDKTKHEGPDHGYLFGLSNLISIFRAIKEEYRSPMDE